jgi:hypothetical protein
MDPHPVETTKKNIVADTDCRVNDVLFGRGSGPSQHEGNRRFRGVVWETFQEYLQGEQERHWRRGEKLCSWFPPSLSRATKSRLCHIVREKVTKMKGRFLQKVTSLSAAATTDPNKNMTCAIHNEESNYEAEKTPYLKTYYRIADENKVLSKIKQTLRFLLDQKYGRKERSHSVRVSTVLTAGGGSSGKISFGSAVPTGILHQGQTGQNMPSALPNDTVAGLLSECRALLPSPPPPLVVAPLQRYNATSLDMYISSQVFFILQQRQQQRRKENERTIALLQLLGTGGDAIKLLHGRNAGYASRQQQDLAVSMLLSLGSL